MNFCRICFLILVCNCISFCRSPSKSITEAFVEVDASLQSSNEIAAGNFKLVYEKIESGVSKGTPQRLLADHMFTLTNDAVGLIDSLIIVLNKKDETGESTSIATSLLVNTETSTRLHQKLNDLETAIRVAYIDSSISASANDLSGDLISPMNKRWDKFYFHETPTVAAVTILNKFQNDCYKAGLEALRNIYKNSRN